MADKILNLLYRRHFCVQYEVAPVGRKAAHQQRETIERSRVVLLMNICQGYRPTHSTRNVLQRNKVVSSVVVRQAVATGAGWWCKNRVSSVPGCAGRRQTRTKQGRRKQIAFVKR